MTRCEGTKLLTRLLKHFRIGLGGFALMLLAASVSGPRGAAVLAEVAHAVEMASSEVVDTLQMIGAEFALSEPIYRGTDRGDAILILALVFSGIVAFNFWFFQHLRCVYAGATALHQPAKLPSQAPTAIAAASTIQTTIRSLNRRGSRGGVYSTPELS